MLVAISAGCSLLPGESGPETAYKDAPQGRSLELPPTLGGGEKRPLVAVPQGSGCAPCAEVAAAQSTPAVPALLPRLSDARMVRDGGMSWLELNASAESVWAGVGQFVEAQGFSIARQSPRDGVVEMDWIDNTRALASPALDALLAQNIPPESLGLHRFSFRLERAGEATTRVFVRHEGLMNSAAGPALQVDDPEMASRLMLDLLAFFGVEGRRANQIVSGS